MSLYSYKIVTEYDIYTMLLFSLILQTGRGISFCRFLYTFPVNFFEKIKIIYPIQAIYPYNNKDWVKTG